jgi:hypothetical protein
MARAPRNSEGRGPRVFAFGIARWLGGGLILLTAVSACANGGPPPSSVGFGVFGDGATGITANSGDATPAADTPAATPDSGSGEADPGSGVEAAASLGMQNDGSRAGGVCDPTCAGCCDSTQTCVSGSRDTACGRGGGLCQDCGAVGSMCQPGGVCSASSGSSSGGVSSSSSGSSSSGGSSGGGCSSASCPTGCCQGGTCHSGGSDFHCGAGGSACVDCTTTMQNCLNHQCG